MTGSGDHPHDLIEVERRCFIETGNAVHAWAAYGLARVNMVPVPDWAMSYLDGVSRGVLALSAEAARKGDAKNMGPQLLKAMRLTSDGSGTGLSAYHRPWISYGMNVRHHMMQGDQETYAIEHVAAAAGVSPSTVRKAWKRYDRLFPGEAIFPDEALHE